MTDEEYNAATGKRIVTAHDGQGGAVRTTYAADGTETTETVKVPLPEPDPVAVPVIDPALLDKLDADAAKATTVTAQKAVLRSLIAALRQP